MKRNSILTILITVVLAAGVVSMARADSSWGSGPVTVGIDHILGNGATSTKAIQTAGAVFTDVVWASEGIKFTSGGDVVDAYISDGTFTPRFYGSTNDGSEVCTYAQQLGFYTRIGSLVHFSIRIQITACSTPPTGAPRIDGLPFTAKVTYDAVAVSYLNTYTLTNADKALTGVVSGSGVLLYEYESGASATNPPVDVAFEIWLSGNLIIAP